MVNRSSSSLSSTERLPSKRRSDSKYKGVRKRKWGKYVSEIRLPNSRERIWLGSHDTPEKAARAFDAALYCLRGEAAKFNFPDNPPDIPGGRSLTPSEIQAAASKFANSGLPESTHSDNRSSSSSSEAQVESPFSDGAPEMESETTYPAVDTSFLDHFATLGSYSGDDTYISVPEYGIFPGFDDFSYLPLPLPNNDYVENNFVFAQETSFLWNF